MKVAVIVGALMLLGASVSESSTVTSTVVDVRINAAQVQPGYTRVSVRTNGTSSCGGGGWFAFQYAPSDGTSGLVGKAWLASVLAALQSGRSVTIINAWRDASGNEIGDKCAWTNLANITTSNGTYAVQPLWSNQANGCVLSTASPKAGWFPPIQNLLIDD